MMSENCSLANFPMNLPPIADQCYFVIEENKTHSEAV